MHKKTQEMHELCAIPESIVLLALDSKFLGFVRIEKVYGHSAQCG